MFRHRIVRGLACAAVCFLASHRAGADEIYWNEADFLSPHGRIVDSSGGGDALFPLDPGSLPEGIAYDATHQKIYWVEAGYTGARILRANQNYTGLEVLVSGGSAFRGLALDVAGGKMYWTSSNQVEGAKIRRANLDGTNVQVLLDFGPGPSNPRGIAVAPIAPGGKIYWADLGLGKIRRANLDGSSLEDFLNVVSPWGVVVDQGGGYVYASSYSQGTIGRSTIPPTGGGFVTLKTGLANPTYLAVDPPTARMYWIEAGAGGQKLRSSNLSAGGAINDLPVAVSTYGGIAYSPVSIVAIPSGPAPVTKLELGAVSPNPMTSSAQVEFALPEPEHVVLRVVDVRGREVGRLLDGERPAGRYQADWNGRTTGGSSLEPGVYFLRLETPGATLVRRSVVLRSR